MRVRKPLVLSLYLSLALSLLPRFAAASVSVPQTPLEGASIPKYQEPLPNFVGARVSAQSLTVRMQEFQQKVLPSTMYSALDPPFSAGTYVWGYKVGDKPAHYPGFSIEARRWRPTTIRYVNELSAAGGPPLLQRYLSVDQTLHWADPLGLHCGLHNPSPNCLMPYVGPVPASPHLHGAEVPSAFDGGPDQWFTPNGLRGPGYATLSATAGNSAIYRYPNEQEATTLFFHDHALGTTRLNVYGGLAAFYLLRDGDDTGRLDNPLQLPAGPREIEIAIQDRMFDTQGQLLYPDEGVNPDMHPFWQPEFFGDAIVVNGKTWPYLEVEPRRYRFRIVDGSNARFYRMALVQVPGGAAGPPIWQIGTDGGLLDAPVPIAPPSRLLLGPGERADIIIDFSKVAFGSTLLLTNDAAAPFPNGDPADPDTTGQIMQFRVVRPLSSRDRTCNPIPTSANPCFLRSAMVRLADPATGTLGRGVTAHVRRQLVLDEVMGMDGPLEVLLNNTLWSGITASSTTSGTPTPVPGSVLAVGNWSTENPQVGATEQWDIINLTADAHPIHLHLVQFQLLNRQNFRTADYLAVWEGAFPSGMMQPGDGPPLPYRIPNADGALGGNPAVSPFLLGLPQPPLPNEAGWKDTVIMYPGQVTRIVVRFGTQGQTIGSVRPGRNTYPFDPTLLKGVGPQRDWNGNPAGPGYVWHCHILEHEDNEMMRPYILRP